MSGAATTRIWDLPIRLWHWTFAACVAFSLYTGLAGDISLMDWHQRSGFAILALLLFRLGWGFWGGRYVRFAHYVTTPHRVFVFFVEGLRRLRRRGEPAKEGGRDAPHTAPGIALVVLLEHMSTVTKSLIVIEQIKFENCSITSIHHSIVPHIQFKSRNKVKLS